MCSTSLANNMKKNIISTMSSIICKSYGPESLMTLMCTSTGRVLTTNNGIVILETLSLSHPLAKLIVKALKKHYISTADGIKTFLLYLSQAVMEMDNLEHTSSSGNSEYVNFHFGNKISLELKKIEQDVLSKLWDDLPSLSTVKTETSLSQQDLESVVTTNIASHLSRKNTSVMGNLILQTLTLGGKLSLLGVYENAGFMIENFDFMHLKVQKNLVQSSSTLSGFLIRRDFSFKDPNLCECKKVKFIMLLCSIEGKTCEDPNEIVYLKDENTATKSFTHQITTASTYLEALKRQGVSLIICSEKVPDFVTVMCRNLKISVVSCVEEEDIEFLERVTEIRAITSSMDTIEGGNIGELSSCKRKIFGTQRFVHLQFPDNIQREIPEMLIIAAPTGGMVDQLADVAYKAYKSLLMCFSFQRSKTSTFDPTKNETDDRIQHLENTDSRCPMFVAIGGGGYFEIQTAQLLKKYSCDFSDIQTGLGCRILHACLLSVPRTLHKQLSRNTSKEARSYMEKMQNMTQSVKEGVVSGLDRRGRVCNPVEKGILEPLAAKLSNFVSMLQLLNQILRIDSVVSVGKLGTLQRAADEDG